MVLGNRLLGGLLECVNLNLVGPSVNAHHIGGDHMLLDRLAGVSLLATVRSTHEVCQTVDWSGPQHG